MFAVPTPDLLLLHAPNCTNLYRLVFYSVLRPLAIPKPDQSRTLSINIRISGAGMNMADAMRQPINITLLSAYLNIHAPDIEQPLSIKQVS